MTKDEIINNALDIHLEAGELVYLQKVFDLMLELYNVCCEDENYNKILDVFFKNIKQNILNHRDIHRDYRAGAFRLLGCMQLLEERMDNPNKEVLHSIYSKCGELYCNPNFDKLSDAHPLI